MAKRSKSTLVGRSAKTGKFETISKARSHPTIAMVVRVPKAGCKKK